MSWVNRGSGEQGRLYECRLRALAMPQDVYSAAKGFRRGSGERTVAFEPEPLYYTGMGPLLAPHVTHCDEGRQRSGLGSVDGRLSPQL